MKLNDRFYEKESFAIFPLYALNLKLDYKYLINCILDYYVISVLKSYYSTKAIRIAVKKLQGEKELDSTEHDMMDDFLKVYKKVRKTRKAKLPVVYFRYRVIHNLTIQYKKLNIGVDAKVGIYTDLLHDIHTKHALTERQFRILIAVYSKIGTKIYQVIYNDEIRYRAWGFKSKDAYNKLTSITDRSIRLYSNKILKKEILYLKKGSEGRGFFDRVYDGRKYYYSIKQTGSHLSQIVLNILSLHKIRSFEENKRNKALRNRVNKILNEQLNDDIVKKINSKRDILRTPKFMNKAEYYKKQYRDDEMLE